MKKFLSWLLVLMFLCSFCSVQALADDANEICGSYTLANMDDGSGMDLSEVMPMMEALGMSATLEIAEDGTAKLDLFGEEEEFTIDFEKEVAVVGDAELELSYEDGTLTLGSDELSMTFIKGKLPPLKGVGAFEYYELESYVDEKGEDLHEKAAAEAETDEIPSLIVYKAGDAVLDFYGTSLSLMFDFENNKFVAEEEEIPFTLEDDVLSFQDAEGATLSFRLADPGYIGPYIMTGLVDKDGDHAEELDLLSSMGMLPTLVIDENDMAILTMFDEDIELALDFETMTAEMQEEQLELTFSYENGTIIMEEEESTMTFSRALGLPKSAAELAETFGF